MAARERPAHWLEIDRAALIGNLALFRSLVATTTRLALVVKANAYGHGLAQVAPQVCGSVDWLAVHSAEEARQVRRLGLDCPLLIMGFVPPSELFDLDREVHVFVSTEQVARWLGEYRQRTGIALPVHLKVETGTHRQGIAVDRIPAMCRTVSSCGLEVAGIATHFANIEDTLEHEFARDQLAKFRHAIERATRELGGRPAYVHAACSAATLLWRESDFDLVRVGISGYGHWPSRETKLSWILEHGHGGLQLQPVLTWRATIGQIQEVATGGTVGYGRSWTALRPSRIAVLPLGYSDGYPRALGNRARVLVAGSRAPVVGRVCMNIMLVDVTDMPSAAVGDTCTVIGADGGAVVTAEELAGLAGTINYEILARIAAHVPRLVTDTGVVV